LAVIAIALLLVLMLVAETLASEKLK